MNLPLSSKVFLGHPRRHPRKNNPSACLNKVVESGELLSQQIRVRDGLIFCTHDCDMKSKVGLDISFLGDSLGNHLGEYRDAIIIRIV